jgi:hypothetical protein
MDVLSYSDPMVVVYERAPNGHWKEKGRTEMIKFDFVNSSTYSTGTHSIQSLLRSLGLDTGLVVRMGLGTVLTAQEIQELKFEVYDVDTVNTRNLSEQDYIGHTVSSFELKILIGQIMKLSDLCTSRDRTLTRKLTYVMLVLFH